VLALGLAQSLLNTTVSLMVLDSIANNRVGFDESSQITLGTHQSADIIDTVLDHQWSITIVEKAVVVVVVVFIIRIMYHQCRRG
jgi:hypothetical protein